MATDWEATLRSWVEPPSESEDTKRDRTEEEIRGALRSTSHLANVGYRVYAKGSYANRTNVRLDYDVDIAVECTDFFYWDSTGAVADVVKAADATQRYTKPYGPNEFKNDVEQALVDRFGRRAVTRGNMAMRVRERQTTLPADVVPCFEYHLVHGFDRTGGLAYHKGTRIYPDRGDHVHNWAQQQYERGVAKNDATGRHYKRMVRALKRLENYLVESKGLGELPSFLMECLVYNVPNAYLQHSTYVADMREVIATIFNATLTDERCKDWLEANERKYLFHPSQGWTRGQAHALADGVWNLMGFC